MPQVSQLSKTEELDYMEKGEGQAKDEEKRTVNPSKKNTLKEKLGF